MKLTSYILIYNNTRTARLGKFNATLFICNRLVTLKFEVFRASSSKIHIFSINVALLYVDLLVK